jgi:hypothetical protein
LVQADGGCVDTHVGKHHVGVPETVWQLQVGREAERRVEEDVVHLAVPFPKLAVQIMISVVDVWAVQVNKIPSKKAGHEDNTSKRREFRRACGAHGVLERGCLLRPAHIEGVVGCRQIRQYVLFVDSHGPPGADAGEAVEAEGHPKGPSPLFSLGPVSRWRQTLLDV